MLDSTQLDYYYHYSLDTELEIQDLLQHKILGRYASNQQTN